MRASTKIPAGNIEEKVRYWHRLLLDLEEKRAEMLRENQERELELQEFDSGKTSNFTVIVAGVMFGVCTLGGIFISAFSRNAGIGPFFAGLGFGVVSAVIVFARDAVESAEIEKHPPSPPHVDTKRIDTAIREAHERLEYWERFKTAPQVQATVPVLNPAVSKVYPEE